MHEPSFIDKLVSACFRLLAAAIALLVVACILQAIWQVLAIAAGVVALVWVGVVVYRATKDRW